MGEVLLPNERKCKKKPKIPSVDIIDGRFKV